MWPGSLNGPSGVGSLTQVGPSRTASRRLQAEADAAPAKEAIQRRDGGDETVSGNRAQLQCGLRYDLRLTVGSLTANGRDRDMPHCRIGLGAMPMAFASLDMHDITHVDLVLFVLRRHHAGARRYHQDLVAVMRVPSCGAALAEIYHAAIIVRGVSGLNDGLT